MPIFTIIGIQMWKIALRVGCPLNRSYQAYSVITGPVRNIGGLDMAQLFHFMSFFSFFFRWKKRGKFGGTIASGGLFQMIIRLDKGYSLFFYIDDEQFAYSHSNLPILKY